MDRVVGVSRADRNRRTTGGGSPNLSGSRLIALNLLNFNFGLFTNLSDETGKVLRTDRTTDEAAYLLVSE